MVPIDCIVPSLVALDTQLRMGRCLTYIGGEGHVYAAVVEEEARKISERTKAALAAATVHKLLSRIGAAS